MLFLNGTGDIMAFRLQDSFFHYEIRVTGDPVHEVQSCQGCLVSSHSAHLCLLDTEHSLSYYRWQGVKWQQVAGWQQVSPSFQAALDHADRFHIIIPSAAGIRYYSYAEEKGQETTLTFLSPEPLLLALYPVNRDSLLLVQQETSEATRQITYYHYQSSAQTWSEKRTLATLPGDCRHLQFFLAQDRLFLTYLLPAGKNQWLHLLYLDTGSGETGEHQLGKLSPSAGPPVLSRFEEYLVLLTMEPNYLVFWRSPDRGQTWTTKGELPCPWPIKLAPVLSPQKEITDYVALEGFYGLELQHPALLTARQLLSLSPYGLWL